VNLAVGTDQQAGGLTQEYSSHDGIKSALLSLYNRVFDFSKGSHYERLGAIQAIDAFVHSTKDDQPDRALQKNIRLYECECYFRIGAT
jgi:FKBP12-rapamycin complex-associated protein